MAKQGASANEIAALNVGIRADAGPAVAALKETEAALQSTAVAAKETGAAVEGGLNAGLKNAGHHLRESVEGLHYFERSVKSFVHTILGTVGTFAVVGFALKEVWEIGHKVVELVRESVGLTEAEAKVTEKAADAAKLYAEALERIKKAKLTPAPATDEMAKAQKEKEALTKTIEAWEAFNGMRVEEAERRASEHDPSFNEDETAHAAIAAGKRVREINEQFAAQIKRAKEKEADDAFREEVKKDQELEKEKAKAAAEREKEQDEQNRAREERFQKHLDELRAEGETEKQIADAVAAHQQEIDRASYEEIKRIQREQMESANSLASAIKGIADQQARLFRQADLAPVLGRIEGILRSIEKGGGL